MKCFAAALLLGLFLLASCATHPAAPPAHPKVSGSISTGIHKRF